MMESRSRGVEKKETHAVRPSDVLCCINVNLEEDDVPVLVCKLLVDRSDRFLRVWIRRISSRTFSVRPSLPYTASGSLRFK
jgi:hypothetical protein